MIATNDEDDIQTETERSVEFGDIPPTTEEVMEALGQRESYRRFRQDFLQEQNILNSDEL